MDEAFIRDTIRMAHAYTRDPSTLTAVAESLGYVGMTTAQLLSRINAVRNAATAGSEVAAWVTSNGGGGVLAGAASDLAASAAATTTAAGAGAGAGAAAVPAWAIAVGAVAAVAVVAAGITGYQAWSSSRDADEAERIADRTSQQAEERRDQVDGGVTALRDDQYVAVQVTNHPGHALAVLGATQYQAHQDGSSPLELCTFLHGGRCEGEEVDTPNGTVTAGPSARAELRVLGTADSSDGAWKVLCGSVTGVRAAPLAEGFVGDYGGEVVTLDARGFSSPC